MPGDKESKEEEKVVKKVEEEESFEDEEAKEKAIKTLDAADIAILNTYVRCDHFYPMAPIWVQFLAILSHISILRMFMGHYWWLKG